MLSWFCTDLLTYKPPPVSRKRKRLSNKGAACATFPKQTSAGLAPAFYLCSIPGDGTVIAEPQLPRDFPELI